MILNKITMCDFRSYGGLHEVELTPRTRWGAERPIVLFGGLNGAGKTTILLAVKLALYGRHALGLNTTKIEYDAFVEGCIHRSNYALVKPNSAHVEIEFTYGKLGLRQTYKVRRSWVQDGKKVQESIRIWNGDDELRDLTQEESQGFLNELIPVGVSELFFFDGEKIAELAEDGSGNALGDAIRRLLGLDLVEKLRNDLRVYSLRREAKRVDKEGFEGLERAQNEFDETKQQLLEDRTKLLDLQETLAQLQSERDVLETRLVENGGTWGKSRQFQYDRANELSLQVKREERDLRDELGGVYPLALAGEVLADALSDVEAAAEAQRESELRDALKAFAKKVKKSLDAENKKVVDSVLKDIAPAVDKAKPLIDVTSKELAEIEHIIRKQLLESRAKVSDCGSQLARIETDLDSISVQIERAPDEQLLLSQFDALSKLNERIAELKADIAVRGKDLKLAYHRAIEGGRTLRRQHERLTEQQDLEQPLDYATRSRALLKDFAQINAERKVRQLETEFAEAFRRLARKEDILARAEIDPNSFAVKLINRDEGVIDKTQLSAGEKQIYAIAMLEALARTSGRRLPVIIDTPLGRLDSKHRTNLVEQYFPRASHQVILLSTDTEVDEPFYKALSPNISHVFEIKYDEGEKTSELREGYFWRQAAYKEAV